jgi:hypothetical protein
MNKLIAGAARRNRIYLPTAFQELTSRNWHIISGLRHPACKENFPRSRKLAFLRNVGTERGRTFVLSKPRLRSAICAAFSRRLRKTAKTLNHQCRRNSGLSVVSRELTSPYNREELYKRVWSQATYGLSDLRLGKVCKKLKIPVPGRGYWANKSAGKPVATRPPLPSAANPPIRVPH